MKKVDYDILLYNNKVHSHYMSKQERVRHGMHDMHNHAHYEILYIFKGERILYVEKEKYLLNKNTIAVLPPYLLHRTTCSPDDTPSKFHIGFTKDFVDKMIKILDIDVLSVFSNNRHVISVDDQTGETVKNLMEKMLKCNDENDVYNDQMFLLMLCELLTIFSKINHKDQGYTENALMDKMIEYVETNFAEEITLDVLAKHFYINKYEISRMFTKNMGISFVKYLTRVRIEYSKNLLSNTELSITQVADLAGFQSPSNFTRVFSGKIGMSPSQYRKIESQKNVMDDKST